MVVGVGPSAEPQPPASSSQQPPGDRARTPHCAANHPQRLPSADGTHRQQTAAHACARRPPAPSPTTASCHRRLPPATKPVPQSRRRARTSSREPAAVSVGQTGPLFPLLSQQAQDLRRKSSRGGVASSALLRLRGVAKRRVAHACEQKGNGACVERWRKTASAGSGA